jgi:hypothetical protein
VTTVPADATGRDARWGPVWPWLLATLFYAGFAVVQTWPLATKLGAVIPNDPGDPLLNTWIVWWNAHSVPFTSAWWNAPAFWPFKGALAFSEVLLGLAPITSPLQAFGGSAVAAYNVAFFVTFPLSALAAHALVQRLSGNHAAGLVAGLVYGFNPFRVAHFPQIQVLTSYWMPVALLGLHEYLRRGNVRWLVVFGGGWLMQSLSNGYYMLFFPALLGPWILWFTGSRAKLRTLSAILAAWAIASLPLVPVLWSYRRIHASFGLQRDAGVIAGLGADVMSLLDASPLLKFWNLHAFHQPEGELFPGFTAALLVLLLVVHVFVRHDRELRMPRIAMALLGGAALFFAVGVSSLLSGGWALVIGNTTVLSVRVASKPLSIAVMLLVAGLALVPRFPEAWRRRSPLMFYTLAMGLMYLLCLGPRPRFLGLSFMARGPYGLLMLLPGYDSIRVPARFAMVAALCLSIVAALAFARLTRRMGRTARFIAAAVVCCGVIVDSALGEMPLRPLPVRSVFLEALPGDAPVLELPIGFVGDDVAAMYRGMYHRHPVMNGYSGYFPPAYDALRIGFENRDPQMFEVAAAFAPIIVDVDTSRDTGGFWVNQLKARHDTTLKGAEGMHQFYALSAGSLPKEVRLTGQLPIHAVKANVNADRVAMAFDGNQSTRWDSGPQKGTEVMTIDLGSTRVVDGITTTIGPYAADYPRELIIDSSLDGREWTERWHDSSAILAFASTIRNPREIPLVYTLRGVSTRYLRLRQVGRDAELYWSICELTVHGR